MYIVGQKQYKEKKNKRFKVYVHSLSRFELILICANTHGAYLLILYDTSTRKRSTLNV